MTGGPADGVFDTGLQHERTSLAWERTAVAMMVAGVLLARYAARDAHPAIALAGIAQTVLGAGTLVWAGLHHEARQDLLRSGDDISHPGAVRVVGLATVAFSTVALALALVESLAG